MQVIGKWGYKWSVEHTVDLCRIVKDFKGPFMATLNNQLYYVPFLIKKIKIIVTIVTGPPNLQLLF